MVPVRPSRPCRPVALVVLLATAPCLFAPRHARANDVELSKEHFRRAVKLAELGKHVESIREFELAYEANPRPSILYNLAYEHKVLAAAGGIDEMRKSVDFYQRYLMASPRASDRREVESMIVELKAQIESAEAAARDSRMQQPAPLSTSTAVAGAPRKDQAEDAAVAAVPPAPAPEPPMRRAGVPVWGWALVGAGAAVVVGGAVGLGVGLSGAGSGPETTLGTQDGRF